jgi:hypothetical protein
MSHQCLFRGHGGHCYGTTLLLLLLPPLLLLRRRATASVCVHMAVGRLSAARQQQQRAGDDR